MFIRTDHMRLILASFALLIAMQVPLRAAAPSHEAECPCLLNGGEPGPGNCPCNVGLCYARCVDELCPSFPQCMLECSGRCYCGAQAGLGCYDHIDPGPTPTPSLACPGDCDGNGLVTVAELVRSVKVLLATPPTVACPNLDWNGDQEVTIHEIIKAVNTALFGCTRQLASQRPVSGECRTEA